MRATTNHKHITPTTKTHLGQRDTANNPHNRGQPATPEHPKQSYGGHSDRETPGPIPNPEAKPASADDTTQPGWKSRTPPNTHPKKGTHKVPFFAFPKHKRDPGFQSNSANALAGLSATENDHE